MRHLKAFLLALLVSLGAIGNPQAENLVLGQTGSNCLEDPHCINRLHPAIPMAAIAKPGQIIVMHTRNASDFNLDPDAPPDPRRGDPGFGTVHPLTGPVHIEGARTGDVIAITLHSIKPGPRGWTFISSSGLISDVLAERPGVMWRLGSDYATSDDLPGVRIPNSSFPGVVTALPGDDEHRAMLVRETALAAAGGAVTPPHALHASPASICGPHGRYAAECLRTIPPREHGGNLDIRYLQPGVTVYLPCQVDGCGLAVGDVHYAQGDGEVAGSALEMDAVVTVSTQILRDGPALSHGPHYRGPASALNIPSRSFYATTGFPLKSAGEAPLHTTYLQTKSAVELQNLSGDLTLAARNAILAMVDYIESTWGYSREQAFIIASVAVDLRIGQLVNYPNTGVTALLPLDIFINEPTE